MKLVIKMMGAPTNSGRLPVKIFTDFNEFQRYSIDLRRISKVWEVFYCKDIHTVIHDLGEIKEPEVLRFYIVEYETPNTDFDLYARSNDFAERLMKMVTKVLDRYLPPLSDMRKGDVWVRHTTILRSTKTVGFYRDIEIVVDIEKREVREEVYDCDADECEIVTRRTIFRW